MTETYEPLREPDYTPSGLNSVEVELAVTRRILDETAPLNIHRHMDMLRAAVSLDCRLRALVAALDAERGEGE
ncbi:hypothetical protein ABZ392_33990 [Streptomyces sp. NPDC005885]|uniref:hypothetical protein n=1 Tax=Streptomyces sp. NPDC005885 TaxID=3157079 RepID=UPI003406857D